MCRIYIFIHTDYYIESDLKVLVLENIIYYFT